MSKEKDGFGFGKEEQVGPYDIYLDHLISTSHNGNALCGILRKIDIENNVAIFKPSVIVNPDGTFYINDELPTMTPLPFGNIYPLQGNLEEHVAKFNDNMRKRQEQETQKKIII